VLVFPVVSFLLAFKPIFYKHSSSPPFVLHAAPISFFLTWSLSVGHSLGDFVVEELVVSLRRLSVWLYICYNYSNLESVIIICGYDWWISYKSIPQLKPLPEVTNTLNSIFLTPGVNTMGLPLAGLPTWLSLRAPYELKQKSHIPR
jgi:hypothetical protein